MNSEPLTPHPSSAFRRIILTVLTVIVSLKLIFSIAATLDQPQIQGKFELYQTNLLLEAADWKPQSEEDTALQPLQTSLVGGDVFTTAIEQYQAARKRDLQAIDKLTAKIESSPPSDDLTSTATKLLQKQLTAAQTELDRVDLNLGILQAVKGDKKQAISTWEKALTTERKLSLETTAEALINIWDRADKIDSLNEAQVKNYLDGWFRDRAMKQLYTVRDRKELLAQVDNRIQAQAENSLVKLAVITSARAILGLAGLGVLIFIIIKLFLSLYRRSPDRSISMVIAEKIGQPWSPTWDWEIIWQVLLVGFFFVGQFLLPLILGVIVDPTAINTPRSQAVYILGTYGLMATLGISVLYFSIKSYLPLPEDWFKFNPRSNWFWWGFGGYLVAIPIVLIVSVLNERLWQGQGGSNPLLQIVLESKDDVALGIFFITAAIAAPLFEEILFRGFLLPSLTRYLPVGSSIFVSALLFGVAHLSLSEIVPLTTLGIILGIVYSRSRNLLAPMLLHGLWNGGTLFSLYILGQ
jgi:membrane protease YdiL (CAAX protease family)